jgi:hypothetical protein
MNPTLLMRHHSGSTSLDELASRRLWKALQAGDWTATSRALMTGADPNAMHRGQHALYALDGFSDEFLPAAALLLVMHGARVTEEDTIIHELVADALPEAAYGCGVDAGHAALGMHSLPNVLHRTFLDVAEQYGAVYLPDNGQGKRTRADERLWEALSQGSMKKLQSALRAGASAGRRHKGRLPIQALGSFSHHDAAAATLRLLAAGSPFDADCPDFFKRLEAGLMNWGFRCGAEPGEVWFGMHMLPPELYFVYRECVAKFNQFVEDMESGAIEFENGEFVRRTTTSASGRHTRH